MDYHALHNKLRVDLTIPEIIFKDCLYYPRKSRTLHFDPKVYLNFFYNAGVLTEPSRHPLLTNSIEIQKHFQNIQQLYTQLQMRKPDWHKLFALALRGDSGMEHFTLELFDRLYPNDRNFCDRPAKPL